MLEYSYMDKNKLYKLVKAHCRENLVTADKNMRTCVDGGYRAGGVDGSIAFPGADLGTAQAMLVLDYSPQDAFGLVYDFATQNGKEFYWHTDTHEGQEGNEVGCGHCNAAIQQITKEKYGATAEETQELLNIVRQKQQDSPGTMECVVLEREHTEKAILLIESLTHSIRPWSEETGDMYFIYDKTRHEVYLNDFVEFCESKGTEINKAELIEAVGKQMDATLGLLGTSKGANIFSIKISKNGSLDISLAGTAPSY